MVETTFKKGQRVKVEYMGYKGKKESYYSTILACGIAQNSECDNPILGDLSINQNVHAQTWQEYYFAPKSQNGGGQWLSVNALKPVKQYKS